MSPALLAIGKLAAPLILEKVEEEVMERIGEDDDYEYGQIVRKTRKRISKKKGAAWAVLGVALLEVLRLQGVIDSSLAQIFIDILSNPEAVEALEEVVQ